MIQRILLELALFSAPFAIFFVYRAMSTRMSVRDRWPLVRLIVTGGVLAIIALAIPALMESSSEGKCFVAQRYDPATGVTTPGQWVECVRAPPPSKAQPPAPVGGPPATAPDAAAAQPGG